MEGFDFNIDIPTRVEFGWGRRNTLLSQLKGKKPEGILLIASANMCKRPLVASLLEDIKKIDVPLEIFSKVEENPRTRDIQDCLDRVRNKNISDIIAIGGGSCLDQAKAISICLDSNSNIGSVLQNGVSVDKRSNTTLYLLPTTSGTGAEVSWGAIVSDIENGVKTGIRGRAIAADYAIVDPELTLTLPLGPTVITGFDVLTHALETYLSRKASAFTSQLSKQAIELVFKHLPILLDDLQDQNGRTALAYASMLMGINLGLSTTCLPHRLQYPVGAATDTTHAEGLAALYPAWLEAVLPFAEEKLANCAEWIQVDNGPDLRGNAVQFIDHVIEFMAQIKMTRSLSELGVSHNMVEDFVSQVSGNLSTDPGDTSKQALTSIYEKSL